MTHDSVTHDPATVISLLAFDLETTGIDPFTDVPVSYALVLKRPGADGAVAEVSVDSGLIDPGRPIPPASSAVHHITDEMVSGAPGLTESVEAVATALVAAWADGTAIVGMNVSYDLTMLETVLARLALPTLQQRRPGLGPVYDVLVLDRTFDRFRKGKRTLTDLCRHYGVDLDDDAAHDAAVDCLATLDVLEQMAERYPEVAALQGDQVSPRMGEWYRAWLGNFNDYRMSNGDESIADGHFEWPIHQAGLQ